jgi:hypothetical protein
MLSYSTLPVSFVSVFTHVCLYFTQFLEQLKIYKNKMEICS